MKAQRHMRILEIIEKWPVDTQEELLERLKFEGVDTTQATISRDIKELRLIKILDEDGHYRYMSTQKDAGFNLSAKLSIVLFESVISVTNVNNMVVVRTLTGMAHAAASAIDAMNRSEIVGTIAGDDTIFILFETTAHAQNLCDDLKRILKQG